MLQFQNIFNQMHNSIKNINLVLTISKSGTLKEIFKLWKEQNKNIKVIISESRPANEGKIFAKQLLKLGIKVELITDAMTALYVKQIDAAVIGTDEVLKNGNIINKVGSNALAILCKEYKKPFYVVTAKDKFSNKEKYTARKADPAEIWNYKNKRLEVSNIYFEEVEKRLITKIFTG